jgi:hypothetical protein
MKKLAAKLQLYFETTIYLLLYYIMISYHETVEIIIPDARLEDAHEIL